MKVEDYVRTKSGYICKIININDFREPIMKYGVEASYLKDIKFIGDEDILKSSPNIIDLIEVGDYVNGSKVIVLDFDFKVIGLEENEGFIKFKDLNVKSIVTKEQFEAMEYRIGE